MDLPVHNQILWHACLLAKERLGGDAIADPLHFFPLMVRGSWYNDTNQVTPFTDLLAPAPNAALDPYRQGALGDVPKQFFHTYWGGESKRLLARLEGYDANIAKAAKVHCDKLTGADDFGKYSPFDHMDVILEEDAVREYDPARIEKSRIAKTVTESLDSATTRLSASSTRPATLENRTAPGSCSALGRALHTIADFFAHTNYVELLLWEVAEQGSLPLPIRNLLNCNAGKLPYEPSFFDAHPHDGPKPEGLDRIFLYSPVTPLNAVDGEGLLVPAFWMNDTPAKTPLASCVFDKQDTAFSMLSLYARYLEAEKESKTLDEHLDFLFSIIDVSGMPISPGVVRFFAQRIDDVRAFFNFIGQKAREALAGWLESEGAHSKVYGDAYKLGADLVRKYDSAEASDWAQAGRLRFLAHSVHDGMGRGLARKLAQDPKTARLPHHTLLSKDHPSSRPDEYLRFALACTLATEVSARVLMWHFTSKAEPTRNSWYEIRDAFLIHPSDQLGVDKVYSPVRIGELASRCLLAAWPVLLDPAKPLETLR